MIRRIRVFCAAKHAGKMLAAVIAACASTVWALDAEVTLDAYAKAKDSQGVVVMSVDWGRRWAFCGFDNVQLGTFAFDRLPVTKLSDDVPADLIVPAPSGLLTGPGTTAHYALLVDPGEYALTSSALRAARSTNDVESYGAGRTKLVRDGKPAAGSFTVSAGELVYVGHFGKECIDGRPTMWRYYVTGREGFRHYLETRVKPKYPFLDTEMVRYKLFRTKIIGHDYDLP